MYSLSTYHRLTRKSALCRAIFVPKMKKTARNERLFELIARAEHWLKENTYSNQLLKWETQTWGEIPADFGRK